jgi:hypothetical protein
MFCRELAVQVHRERDAIRAAGAEVVLVGSGTPAFARAFAEDFHIEAPLYVDPMRRTYRALGMGRPGILRLLASPKVIAAGLRALRGGFRQGAIRGDPYQLGGVLVVRRSGELVFRHVAEDAGDHPDLGEVVRAASRTRAA